MGRTKRQHYVPQCYLKRFSFDGTRLHTFIIKPDTPITLTDEELSEVWKDISICDVCVAKDYYTIDETNRHNNNRVHAMALEKDFFQNFAEPKLLDVIETWDRLAQSILNDKTLIASIRFSEKQRQDLALCAFIQYHRSPRLRHDIESVDKVIRLQHKLSREEEGLLPEPEFKGLDVAFSHADKTFMNTFLWRMFYAKVSSYCLLLRVSENGNFFTSDNPVVIHNLARKCNAIFHVNFYQDDFTLFFPLTPHLMLEYYCPSVFPDSVPMNDTISMVSKKYEDQVNKYQYISAENFIFSHKNDFSLFIKPNNE